MRFWLPNLLSLSRIALLPLILNARGEQKIWLALGLLGLAALTDYLDGLTARWLKVETEFGAFIDPLCDKVLLLGILIAVVFRSKFQPAAEFWLITLIIIETCLTLIRFAPGAEIKANWFGKIKMACEVVAAAAAITGLAAILEIAILIALILALLSLFGHYRHLDNQSKEQP